MAWKTNLENILKNISYIVLLKISVMWKGLVHKTVVSGDSQMFL